MMRFTLRQRSRQERLVYFCTIWTSLGPFDEFEDWAKGLHLLLVIKAGEKGLLLRFSWIFMTSFWLVLMSAQFLIDVENVAGWSFFIAAAAASFWAWLFERLVIALLAQSSGGQGITSLQYSIINRQQPYQL